MNTAVDKNQVDGGLLAAERLHAGEIGKSCDFDYNEVEKPSAAEVLADEITDKFYGCSLNAATSLQIATFVLRREKSATDSIVENAIIVETIRSMLERVISAKKPQFEASCILLAMGMRTSNRESMRGTAKAYGVSANAVSKRVKDLQSIYELPANTFNKSAYARSSYQLTNGQRKKL